MCLHRINRAIFRLPVEPGEVSPFHTCILGISSLSCAILTVASGWRMGHHVHKFSTGIHLAVVGVAHAFTRAGFNDVRAASFAPEQSVYSGNDRAFGHKLAALFVRFALCGMSLGAMGLTISKFRKACLIQHVALGLSLGDLAYWQFHSGAVDDAGRLSWI